MRPIHARLLSIAAISALVAGVSPQAAEAQNAAVKTVFDNYNLLGTFAFDCSQPASANNLYYVHRLVDPGHVQRDRMSGPANRDYAFLIDAAAGVGPNQVSVGGARAEGNRKGEPIVEIWRVEPDRLMIEQQTISGAKVIVDGRNNGRAVPWYNRCAATQAPPAPSAQPRTDVPAAPPPAAVADAGCRTDNFNFSAVLGQGTTANSVSTGGATCIYKVAPTHPDQVQFTSGEIVKQASNGTFEKIDAFAFRYQPRPGFRGMDEVAIKVCGHNSQRAGCAIITYRVNVR